MAAHVLLLADDSITIQRVIELTFSNEDVRVITVGDGEEAIARIASERPDVVLADIGMPKRSGYDVAAFVRKEASLSHIPVLLLAGAFEPVDEARARDVGAAGVLVKPFEPQHVITRVRELLAGGRGSATEAPAADIPRPVARLARPHGVELPPLGYLERLMADNDDFEFGPLSPARHPEADGRARSARETTVDAPPRDGSLADYFDRLDAAFVDLDAGESRRPDGRAVPPADAAPGRAVGPVTERELDDIDEGALTVGEGEAGAEEVNQIPTLEELLGEMGERDAGEDFFSLEAVPMPPPTPVQEPRADSRNPLADAFSALLSAEQGEAVPAVRIGPPPPPPLDTEKLVDEITERVVARLRSEAGDLRDLVTRITSEVAERLVREEIRRIRERRK